VTAIGGKVNPIDGQYYVCIPPGILMMGCSPGDSECADAGKSVHEVKITTGYWAGQTVVTLTAYQCYSQAMRTAMPPEKDDSGRLLNNAAAEDKLPVVCVTWDEAAGYCAPGNLLSGEK
jgi:formylglycine-generating enzyme required for sulfatase activity